MTASGARSAAAIIERQSHIARETERTTRFAWDTAHAGVSRPADTQQAANRLTLTATIPDVFHIHGDRAKGLSGESLASDPYKFTFIRAPHASWLVTNVAHVGPWT